jgi:chromosomal replication initiator protein
VTRQRLNPRYSFQSFVVAESNRLAVAAAIACAERPGEDYNPVFIYSTPGLGKTHLLQAVAQRANQCGHEAVYVTSEHFTNEFISAVSLSRTDEFRRRYRSAKLLCIDDIQFLAGKGRTQEEFFYTFNDLHSDGCQIVLAADRPPNAITGFEPRLSSRFGWGLIADIQPPDEETRLAILQCKAKEQRVELPPDVARFLADRTRDNVRELEGTLNQVVALARITTMRINIELARKALAALTPTAVSPSDPQEIVQAVCEYYGVSVQQITGKSRAKPIAEARHIAMYILREDGELALKQIGLQLGHRDHSTVIHGIQKVTRLLATDQKLAAQIAEIRAQIS